MDTCAVSEAMKPRPNRGLAHWLRDVDEARVYISVVTFGEIRKGAECCADPAKKARIEAWLMGDLVQQFADRVLSFDANVADRWGRLVAEMKLANTTPAAIDSLIAATALHHNLSIITRNVRDFAAMRVGVTNPWSEPA